MILKMENEYSFGILVLEEYNNSDYIHGHEPDDVYEVNIVYVDTANNPTKTTKLFAKTFKWNSFDVIKWIERKMNE